MPDETQTPDPFIDEEAVDGSGEKPVSRTLDGLDDFELLTKRHLTITRQKAARAIIQRARKGAGHRLISTGNRHHINIPEPHDDHRHDKHH